MSKKRDKSTKDSKDKKDSNDTKHCKSKNTNGKKWGPPSGYYKEYEARRRGEVCTQVPKYVILTDLPRYAAIAFTVIFFCTCSGGLNILQSESLIISSTAMRGKIPCLWHVRATEISTEKTSLPSGSESW